MSNCSTVVQFICQNIKASCLSRGGFFIKEAGPIVRKLTFRRFEFTKEHDYKEVEMDTLSLYSESSQQNY